MRRKKKNRVTSPFYYVNPADYGIHDAAVAYQGGGGVKPIYVNDPKDPRLKAYKDSLDYFNDTVEHLKYYNKNFDSKMSFNQPATWAKNKMGATTAQMLNEYSSNKNKPLGIQSFQYGPEGYDYIVAGPTGRHETNPVVYGKGNYRYSTTPIGVSVPIFKKPVQPVIYEPKQKKVPYSKNTKLGNDITPNGYDEKHPPIYVDNPKDERIGYYHENGSQYLYRPKKNVALNKTVIKTPVSIEPPTTTAKPRGGQDFPPVDRIMGPSGDYLYRKDFAPEIWNKMAPPRKSITFEDGGEIPNQAYLGLQQAAQRYWEQGGYDPHQRPNVATGQADYVPIESLLLPATPMIRGIGKVGNMVVDAVNPLSGMRSLKKVAPNLDKAAYEDISSSASPILYHMGATAIGGISPVVTKAIYGGYNNKYDPNNPDAEAYEVLKDMGIGALTGYTIGNLGRKKIMKSQYTKNKDYYDKYKYNRDKYKGGYGEQGNYEDLQQFKNRTIQLTDFDPKYNSGRVDPIVYENNQNNINKILQNRAEHLATVHGKYNPNVNTKGVDLNTMEELYKDPLNTGADIVFERATKNEAKEAMKNPPLWKRPFYEEYPNKNKQGGMIRNYKRGGRVFYDMAIPRYDDGAVITTAAGTTYVDPYQTGPTMQDGSFYTQGNPGTDFGKYAGYAQSAVGALQGVSQAQNNPNLSNTQKTSATMNAVVDNIGSIFPWYGYAKQGEALAKSFNPPKGENREYKPGFNKAFNEGVTSEHEKLIDNWAHSFTTGKDYDKALIRTGLMGTGVNFGMGLYTGFTGKKDLLGPSTESKNILPKSEYWAYNGQVAADGGQVRPTVINVEKNELEVDKNGNIVKDFKHLPPHPETGINPNGTVIATPGNTIISKNLSKKYLTSDKAQRDRIINTLVLAQQVRDKKEQLPPMNKYGGSVKKYRTAGEVTYDPYMVNSFDPNMTATPEEQAIIEQQMSSRFGNSFVPRNPNYIAPQAMVWNPEVGPRMEDNTFSTQGYAGDPVRKTDWNKVGNIAYNTLPYIGDSAQMLNALFSKPKHGSRLRNSLGMKYLDTLGGKYDPSAEARANREAYLAARGSIRDLTGGSTGSYLSGMSNLSSNAYKANSDIYTRAHNIDMENAYRKAEYARALGTEDAQYQGLYEQDKLMAEAKRREMIFGPMQNMGKTALLQDQYSRLYPRYRRRGGRV